MAKDPFGTKQFMALYAANVVAVNLVVYVSIDAIACNITCSTTAVYSCC